MSEDVVVDRVERVERPLASRVCRRCNRRLSASASVQNGMGRVCRLKAGVEPEQLKLGLFGEEETAMGGIDSVIEPMGEEDIASMERWNEREEEIDRLRARVAELEEGRCSTPGAITPAIAARRLTGLLSRSTPSVSEWRWSREWHRMFLPHRRLRRR